MSVIEETTTTTMESSGLERLTGCVKWFNNRAGYGFITVTDGLKAGSDIFVHHSAIDVSSNQFKYLVQGEYIEFSLVSTENSTHEFQAANVTGIKGGKLMYETRRDFTNTRDSYRNNNNDHDDDGTLRVRMPRQRVLQDENNRPRIRQRIEQSSRQRTEQSSKQRTEQSSKQRTEQSSKQRTEQSSKQRTEQSSKKPRPTRENDGSWSKV
jgi:cold shock CspA family protein